jgi:hypothetical protein
VARGGRRRLDVELLLLGEAAALGEDLGGLCVATAAPATGDQEDQHDQRGERKQPTEPVAEHLLATLTLTRLALTLLALTTERLLLIPPVRHGGEA